MQTRIMHGRRARQRAPRRARHRAPPCLRDQGRRPGAPPANTRPSGVASRHSVRPAPSSGALSAGPGPAPGRKCSAVPAGAPAWASNMPDRSSTARPPLCHTRRVRACNGPLAACLLRPGTGAQALARMPGGLC